MKVGDIVKWIGFPGSSLPAEIIGDSLVDTGSITDEIDKDLVSGGFLPFFPDRGFKFDSQVKLNHIGTAAYKILKAQNVPKLSVPMRAISIVNSAIPSLKCKVFEKISRPF